MFLAILKIWKSGSDTGPAGRMESLSTLCVSVPLW